MNTREQLVMGLVAPNKPYVNGHALWAYQSNPAKVTNLSHVLNAINNRVRLAVTQL